MKHSTSRAGFAATLNPELVPTEAYVGGPWAPSLIQMTARQRECERKPLQKCQEGDCVKVWERNGRTGKEKGEGEGIFKVGLDK